MNTLNCWCGQPNREQCCAPVLNGTVTAPTPVALMRARYSAYVTGNRSFLLSSWHPRTRPGDIPLDPAQRWLGLKIKDAPAPTDSSGEVEFVARYKINGRGHRLHERSRFVRDCNIANGHWLYLDGELLGER